MPVRPEIAVYIMTDRRYGALYTGVTANLTLRVGQHRAGEGSTFSSKYNCNRLVWFEPHSDMRTAIAREKAIKKYPRQWKINLIEAENPDWIDLWQEIRPGPLRGQWRSIAEVRAGGAFNPQSPRPENRDPRDMPGDDEF